MGGTHPVDESFLGELDDRRCSCQGGPVEVLREALGELRRGGGGSEVDGVRAAGDVGDGVAAAAFGDVAPGADRAGAVFAVGREEGIER